MSPSRDADEWYRLLEANGVAWTIFFLDPEGRVATWNRGSERLLGYGADEIVGRHLSTVHVPEDRAAGLPDRALELARTAGQAEGSERRLRKDGTEFWADVTLTALRDETGALRGFAQTTRDASARRTLELRAQSVELRFRLLVESVREYAIFAIDPAGNVRTWNPGAQRLKGYSADEIVGKDFRCFYTNEDVAAGRPDRLLAEAEANDRAEDEGWRVRKGGARFWASVVVSAMRDESGRLLGFAKVTRDLTAGRKAEQDRVDLLAAEERIRIGDEFLMLAAHELNTPLTALLIQVQSLRRVADGSPVSQAWRDRFATMERSSMRLAMLVSELVDVSRASRGNLDLQLRHADLAHLARQAVEESREPLAKAGCAVAVDGPETLVGWWDVVRIQRVLSSLLSNAGKFGAGAPVEVALGGTPESAWVRVTDHGIGIARENQSRIFERYERGAPADYAGLGLGLWISREVALAHGGTLTVESEPGRGATFTLTLPRSPRAVANGG